MRRTEEGRTIELQFTKKYDLVVGDQAVSFVLYFFFLKGGKSFA